MKKDWIGLYDYKGFTIRYSEYYQFWDLEASYLHNIEQLEKVQNDYNFPTFKTITTAKKWIKENEYRVKTEINILLGLTE